MLELVTEYVAGLGLDVAKKHCKSKMEDHRLRADLCSFIENQRKYQDLCSLAEEIDFQGLGDYIKDHLIIDVEARVFSPSPKERREARQEIINQALSYSKADTEESRQKVARWIDICLDIIRDFYCKQISLKDYILASDIVNATTEIVDASTAATLTEINQAKTEIIDKMDHGTLFSLDKSMDYVKTGKIDDLGMEFTKYLDHLSIEHPYYPYYGFDYKHGKMISAPRNTDAVKRFPPTITITGATRIGDEYYNDPNGDPLDYSYRHQLPLVIEVRKAVKLLGEKPDPCQSEVAELVGHTVIAKPPEFPPAFPCSIKVRETTFFDYVLLRTREIEDDGTYVINNIEQNCHLYFEVRINLAKPAKPDFKIKIDHCTNKERLQYVKFMEALSKEKDLNIYLLSEEKDLLAGYIDPLNLKTGFASIDEEIDFLERICAIEDYFKVSLSATGDISKADYDKVIRLSDLIRKDQIEGTWTEATFTGTTTPTFRAALKSETGELHQISFVYAHHVELFGTSLDVKIMRSFYSARFADIDKVKKKVELLEDGESIKITFCAGDDNRAIETLKISAEFETSSAPAD